MLKQVETDNRQMTQDASTKWKNGRPRSVIAKAVSTC